MSRPDSPARFVSAAAFRNIFAHAGRDGPYGVVAAGLVSMCAPLLAILTFDPGQGPSVMRGLSIPVLALEWAVVVLALLDGFRPLDALRKLAHIVLLPLGVWAIWATVSSIMAERPMMSGVFLAFTVTHVVFAIALWDRLSGNWQALRWPMLIGTAFGLAVFVALAHVLAGLGARRPDFDWQQFGLGVVNVRHLGFFAVSLMGLGMGLFAAIRFGRLWWLAAGLAGAGLYFTAWTGGRSPFLAAFVILAVIVSLMGRERRWSTGAVLLAIGIAAMPLTLLTAPASEHYGLASIMGRTNAEAEQQSPSVGRRVEMWSQTAAHIAQRPLVGHGQNNWMKQVEASYDRNAHPHNAALQAAYDWGLPGAAALLVIALAGLLRLPRWLSANRALALPPLGVLAGLGTMAMTDGVLFFAYPQFMVAVSVAVLASIGPGGRQGTERAPALSPAD